MKAKIEATHREVVAHEGAFGKNPVHAQHVLQARRERESRVSAFNGWLADHIVAVVGTMACAYLFLALTLVSLPAALQSGDTIVIVSWIAQTFLQLVLLPIIIVGQNRAEERTHVKDEVDHRAQEHLYKVNDEQLAALKRIEQTLAKGSTPSP